MKKIIIPRLELRAAVLLSKLIVHAVEELQISEIYCFSDAQVILAL